MANLKLKNPSGGSLNFVSADGASDLTVTFPATTGTAMVSGNMPAFSVAKVNSNQGLTTNVYAKITFDTEYFDTNNNFASSTFTPTVAGYYQFNACLYFYSSTSNSRASIQLKKSGSVSYFGQYITGGTTSDFMLTASNIFYMNGTTDYMEVWGVVTSGGSSGVYYDSNGATTYFNGALIRAA
jgi:hypothetical protein